MTPPSHSDEHLLREWHAGNKRMGSELFHRHFASIQRFFRNKVFADDIEDLVQQTFLGCLESIESFRGDSSFRTYLFSIAKRRLYDYFRSRSRTQERRELDLRLSSVRDIGMTPSSAVAAAQEHVAIVESLQQLSVERQTLLELFYWEGLRGPELAAVLDVAPATVRTRLFRARAELKEILERRFSTGAKSAPAIDVEASLRAAGANL